MFKKCYSKISAEEAKELMGPGKDAVLLDVREMEEYNSGHIPHSKNIPLSSLNLMINKLPENRRTPIVTYCLTGMRARRACKKLKKLGYENIYCMGGIHLWPYDIEQIN